VVLTFVSPLFGSWTWTDAPYNCIPTVKTRAEGGFKEIRFLKMLRRPSMSPFDAGIGIARYLR